VNLGFRGKKDRKRLILAQDTLSSAGNQDVPVIQLLEIG
jgi:hypothetical protein